MIIKCFWIPLFYLIPTVSFYLWSHSQRFSSPAWITMSCLPIGLSTTLGQVRTPWTETRLRFQMPSFQPSSALKGILCFSQYYAMREWVFPLGHELSLKASLWRETGIFLNIHHSQTNSSPLLECLLIFFFWLNWNAFSSSSSSKTCFNTEVLKFLQCFLTWRVVCWRCTERGFEKQGNVIDSL